MMPCLGCSGTVQAGPGVSIVNTALGAQVSVRCSGWSSPTTVGQVDADGIEVCVDSSGRVKGEPRAHVQTAEYQSQSLTGNVSTFPTSGSVVLFTSPVVTLTNESARWPMDVMAQLSGAALAVTAGAAYVFAEASVNGGPWALTFGVAGSWGGQFGSNMSASDVFTVPAGGVATLQIRIRGVRSTATGQYLVTPFRITMLGVSAA